MFECLPIYFTVNIQTNSKSIETHFVFQEFGFSSEEVFDVRSFGHMMIQSAFAIIIKCTYH